MKVLNVILAYNLGKRNFKIMYNDNVIMKKLILS